MQDIKILLFSSQNNTHQDAIIRALPKIPSVSVYRTIEDFADAVARKAIDGIILLAITFDEKELDELIVIQKQLKDHPLILVLNSTGKNKLKKASRLYPRYTSYLKKEYTDISQVLEKLTTKLQNRSKGGEPNV